MYRLQYTAGDEGFPKWYRELFAKYKDEKRQSTGRSHSNIKMIHLWWRRGTAIPNLGKDNCKERLGVIIYWKNGGLSEWINRPITICDGRFYIIRRGTYATRPQEPDQRVNSINTVGEGNLHQVNSINADRLRGIHDDDQYIWKTNMCTVSLVLPIVKASLRNYQGAKRILAKRKGGTSEQH